MLDKEDVKISLVEWSIIIGLVLVVDIIGALIEMLDLTGIGIIIAFVVTGLLDVFVGFSLFMYCLIRGIPMTTSRAIILLGGFLLEVFPVIGGFTWWTLDVVVLMLSVRAEEGHKLAALANKTLVRAMVFVPAKGSKKTPQKSTAGKTPPLLAKQPFAGPVPPILPPRPGEPGYGQRANQPLYGQNQGLASFQNRVRAEAEERADGLRRHEEKYREEIEKEIKEYGPGARPENN